jgi:hypothetical protein
MVFCPIQSLVWIENIYNFFEFGLLLTDADLDLTFHPDADPDSDFYLMRIQLFILMRIWLLIRLFT